MEREFNQTSRHIGAELLAEETFAAERKVICIGHYRNRRGEYLRISESNDTGYDFVIVPLSGARELRARLDKIIQAATTFRDGNCLCLKARDSSGERPVYTALIGIIHDMPQRL
jgi:hypothetical protein